MGKCKESKVCYKKANLDPLSVVRNVVTGEVDPGTPGAPPDSTMAVGPEVFVTPVNQAIAIFDKSTQQRIFIQSNFDFFPFPTVEAGGGDVQIIYDEVSQRFFYLSWARQQRNALCIIDPPNPAAGEYPGSKGSRPVSQNFNIHAPIEATIPFNADTPVTNDLTGKIALIATDGYKTGSVNKGNNAAAAGAIGALFYASLPGDPTNIAGSTLIPSMIVNYGAGLIISPNVPAVGTIQSTDEATIFNAFYIAVSKTPNPRSSDDWYKYEYVYPDSDEVVTDFPKIAVDLNNFYVSTQNFAGGGGGEEEGQLGNQVQIFDKQALLDGTGPIRTDSKFFKRQDFMWPSQQRFPKVDVLQPQFFISTNESDPDIPSGFGDSTALRIFYTPDFNYIEVPYPTPMIFNYNSSLPQPAADALNLDGAGVQWTLPSVVFNDSLWVTQLWSPNTTRHAIRWYELDISKVVTDNIITLKQWGDVLPCQDDLNVTNQSINVDKDGNTALCFTLVGKTQAPVLAYTGRLKNDPPGTMRYPYQIPIQNVLSYDGANQGGINRWGDYSAVCIDPVDHKTFYAINELPSPLPDFVDPETLTSFTWTEGIVVFQINRDCPSTPNKPTRVKICSNDSALVQDVSRIAATEKKVKQSSLFEH